MVLYMFIALGLDSFRTLSNVTVQSKFSERKFAQMKKKIWVLLSFDIFLVHSFVV